MVPDDWGDDALIHHMNGLKHEMPNEKFRVVLHSNNQLTKSWLTRDHKLKEWLDNQGKSLMQEFEVNGENKFLSLRTVDSDGKIFSSPGAALDSIFDQGLLLDSDEADRIRNEKGSRISRGDYIRSPERAYPGIIIYPFNLILMEPKYLTSKQRESEDYKLTQISEFPHIGLMFSFPVAENMIGIKDRDLQKLNKKTRYITQVNKVMQKQMKLGLWEIQDVDE